MQLADANLIQDLMPSMVPPIETELPAKWFDIYLSGSFSMAKAS